MPNVDAHGTTAWRGLQWMETLGFTLTLPGGPKSRLEQRPDCGYKQKQIANSCCPLSCQGPEDLSAK